MMLNKTAQMVAYRGELFFKENLQHFVIMWDLIYLFLQRGLVSPHLLLQVLFPFFCFQKFLLQDVVLLLRLPHTIFNG